MQTDVISSFVVMWESLNSVLRRRRRRRQSRAGNEID